MFSWIVFTTRLPILMTYSSLSRFESISVTSLISIARAAAPSPIETPTSATANAGVSLTPIQLEKKKTMRVLV